MSTKKYIGGSIQIVDGTQGEGKILMSDSNGLASWSTSSTTSILATASDSTLGGIIVGTGLTMSNSGVLSLSSLGATYTAGIGLTVSVSTFSLSIIDSNIIYVSVNGSDLNTGLNPLLPKGTLKAARDQAVSGDTIHVFPGLFLFDNTNGIYDANLNDLNLWKDGVTYYWSPGCKLKMIARFSAPTTTMILFNPINANTAYETCKSVGYLEYEQWADSSNGGAWGLCIYFSYSGATTGTDYGCTFYSQTKSQIGQGSHLITVSRGNSTNTSSVLDLTFISDYEYNKYLAGLSGGSFTYGLYGGTAADLPMTFKSIVKDRDNSNNSFLTIRNMWGPSSYVYFGGETLRQNGYTTGSKFFEPRVTSTLTVNVDIKKMYLSTTNPAQGLVIEDQFNSTSLGTTFNIKGDLVASYASGVNMPIFSLRYNTTVNYDGNIYTNSNSSIGNTIASVISSTSIINIKGNISYLGTTTTTNSIFKTNSGGVVKYTGNISGNFSAAIAQCGSGTIEINNSNIKSTISGPTSYVLLNGGTSLGTIRVNNSYIELSNSTNPIGNGSYVKVLINNSTIINSGTASGISNTTNFGTLQILNSLIYSTTTPVNYTGTASVIASNVTTNVLCVGSIIGGFDLISDLSF